jgi:hypothetical protein
MGQRITALGFVALGTLPFCLAWVLFFAVW